MNYWKFSNLQAMFRALTGDFKFDLLGHPWFGDENFWTSVIEHY